jgi:tryptophanyl-tRNA synthetase
MTGHGSLAGHRPHPGGVQMSTELLTRPSLRAAELRSAELDRAIAADPAAFRVLTGDRPTGPLHVGHYFGTLQNRVRLQDAGLQMIVLIADYQALTDRSASGTLPADVLGLVADYLAVGIDPDRATIFAHSQVPALNQLLLPFLSLVSVAEVGRNPTVKEETAAAGQAGLSALMFSYPVHQAADILSCRANLVPVGSDQLPHLELTRVIARRFNDKYSPGEPFFAEPAALLSSAPLLLGVDGRKMSKSRGNAIAIGATADQTARLIARAKTDSERSVSYEPARRPELASLLLLAALCLDQPPEDIANAADGNGAAGLKAIVTDAVNARFAAIRTRRAELAADRGYLRQVLLAGNEKARATAADTLDVVMRLMHTSY